MMLRELSFKYGSNAGVSERLGYLMDGLRRFMDAYQEQAKASRRVAGGLFN